MRVRFTVNGQDFSRIAAKFHVTKEIGYEAVITTLDQTEHPIGEHLRDVIIFRLFVSIDASVQDFRALMRRPLVVEYDDPDTHAYKKRTFRIDSNLEREFEMKSHIYGSVYSTDDITLRCLEADRIAGHI